MEDLHIKRLESKDAGFLSEVALKAYADHYLHLWYDGGRWYMDNYFSSERLTDELKDQNSCFYLALVKDVAVGFLKLKVNAPVEDYDAEKALELERIYLKKETAGQGIGRELVNLTLKIAKENNKQIVWLKAMATSEGAIAFYKKMGFKITGTHLLKHPLMKEELRGMVVMIKTLRE